MQVQVCVCVCIVYIHIVYIYMGGVVAAVGHSVVKVHVTSLGEGFQVSLSCVSVVIMRSLYY